jgi:hypothetical protein
MDTIKKYRGIVRKVIKEYSKISYSYGDIQSQTVFDTEDDHYLLLITGREGVKRVHGCLVHIDIIGEKIWVQRDGTEDGITTELLRAGVPKDRIVLGFRSPEMRKHTEFATE